MSYNCDICGRECFKKIRLGGYTLCSKHMHQFLKHGRFLDNNPRSSQDLNDFRIDGNIVIFDLYDNNQYKNGEFIIDLDDLEKVRYHKWRASYGHIVTGNSTNTNPTQYIHRLILNCTDKKIVVDHINCNPYDNRKCNLRICTQSENVLNKSKMSSNTTNFIGVYPDNRPNRKTNYRVEIRYQGKRVHLGSWELLEEAVYARWLAEIIIFGPYRHWKNDDQKHDLIDLIPTSRKVQISTYVSNKINEKLRV